ncbi:hypothetical protein F4818DRAFT_436287 [Hypoxylon cercidicola]|nr:hypothetical protein F4818DRAFT_436287 [Hypoxylon cercidicola]
MPVLTKRRRAEMEATAEGREQLEIEANLQLLTPKRRRAIPSEKSSQKIEQTTRKTPTDQSTSSAALDVVEDQGARQQTQLEEQEEVDAQLKAEQAYHRPVPLEEPDRESDGAVDELSADAPSVSGLRPQLGQEQYNSSPAEISTETPSKTPSNRTSTKRRAKTPNEESSEDKGLESGNFTIKQIGDQAETINVTKLLIEHADKYGVAALPSQEALQSWLDRNKDEFAKANTAPATFATAEMAVTVPPHQGGAPAAAVSDTYSETPAAHPSARLPVERRGHTALYLRPREDARQRRKCCGARAVNCVRGTAASVLRLAAAILDPDDRQQQRQRCCHQPSAPAAPAVAASTATSRLEEDERATEATTNEVQKPKSPSKATGKKSSSSTRSVAPPLDARFFHPNGELRTAYMHLAARIPLPLRWVLWAVENRHYYVPGRGDIRDSRMLTADDNFDYDALHAALKRSSSKAGDLKVDAFREEHLREGRPAAAAFHHFSHELPPLEETQPQEEDKAERNAEQTLKDGASEHQSGATADTSPRTTRERRSSASSPSAPRGSPRDEHQASEAG